MVSVFATLYYTVTARDAVHNIAETHNAGPAILDRIEEDFRHLWVYDLPANRLLLGRDLTVAGVQADALDFVAGAESAGELVRDDRRVQSPISEVGYHLRGNPANADFLELWRREDFFLDDEPFRGGNWQLVYDRIKYFNVTYFASLGPDAEPLEEWATEAQGKFPRRIQVDLAIETQPRLDRGESAARTMNAPRVVEFSRTILPSPDLDRMLAARLRPRVPTPPRPAGNTMATAGKGGALGLGPGGVGGAFTAGTRRGSGPDASGARAGPPHGPGGPAFPLPPGFHPPGGGGGGGGIFVPP